MTLQIPDLCLVVLVGPSGSGKSSFARKHFRATEIISSDECRGLVADDPNSQAATSDAFDVLQFIGGKRLARGRLTVIDATNVQEESRRPLVRLAREHDVLPVAIVLNIGERTCADRNSSRADRKFGPHVVRTHCMQLRRSLRGLQREGFRYVHVLNSVEEVDAATIERQPLWNNRQQDHGPFDIIGDVHGCFDELVELLGELGYRVGPASAGAVENSSCGTGFQPVQAAQEQQTPFPVPLSIPTSQARVANPCHDEGFSSSNAGPAGEPFTVTPPPGRKAVFLGDLCDRGPKSPQVLRLVMGMVKAGTALCVPGNHDVKLLKKLRGRDVKIAHGLAETLEQLAKEPPEFSHEVADFIDRLVSHYVLDGGRLVAAHAGMKQRFIGRASGRVRDFALYGDTTGEVDDAGLPVRLDWAAEYRGDAAIVYGHTPVPEPTWHNNTINIDTGCVFGGKLSALRWPEKQIVSVLAHQTYAQTARTFLPPPVMGEDREFGQRIEGAEYRARPGTYAIITDEDGRIAVMKIGPTHYFLPGGGAEENETHHQTLRREVREECGREIRILRRLGNATQLIGSEGRHLAKQGTYYEAAFVGEPRGAVEKDHELCWLTPTDAIDRLKHEAQKWAVQSWAAAREALPLIQHDDVLDINDVLGKRVIQTRLGPSVLVREENAIAALEVMSRFAADPRWLIYLPPTMSPSETSRMPGLLEHPAEAFEYYRANGVASVICEEKHMGSRAVAIVCRDPAAVRRRFGIEEDSIGIIYTRTGRRFFEDRAVEQQMLATLHRALESCGYWEQFKTDWFCFDCELMPWSAKAQELLKNQYAAVGSAARAALPASIDLLEQANVRFADHPELSALLAESRERFGATTQFIDAYRRYCWNVASAADLRLAPFHLLASEGKVHTNRDHPWHMQTLAKLAQGASPMLMATRNKVIDLAHPASVALGIGWWEELTAAGGEGMVVKPLQFIVQGPKGILQPAVKCRGREYLRIIYGPDYCAPKNLERLRSRGLGAKRAMALRQFALGIESLERFVSMQPLHRVHECVFGILALESEPVDPRL
ncbi:MAG TPA: AAA family ATPase [Humisphaera sp.]|nr:AAA family ATPase [Humisphaera sp.]